MNFRFAKVIATMGPSIEKETILKKIINYIDVFRINFSHSGLLGLQKYVDIIRKIDVSKSIIFDTKGPEIRVKNVKALKLDDKKNIKILYSKEFKENVDDLYIDFNQFSIIPKGCIIAIDDNKVLLRVDTVKTDHLICKVLEGEEILPNKTLVFKDIDLDLPFLTDEDIKGILWAIRNNITFVAASFIRSQEDIIQLRNFLDSNGGSKVRIIAKIETKGAVENIEKIIKYADAVMLARGDLGMVYPLYELTKIQLDIINISRKYGKPVIMATQVLPTMVNNFVPSRAEIDEVVYNLKFGVDSFMLSEETAIGKNPYNVLYWLDSVIQNNYKIAEGIDEFYLNEGYEITDNIIYTAYKLSEKLDIKAIICPTETGYTPTRLSVFKPKVPIIAFTSNDDTFNYLSLLWGVKGYKVSNDFDYFKMKALGKEMVKVIFKGDVDIYDKILIVHSSVGQNMPGLINGIEIYKFKDL